MSIMFGFINYTLEAILNIVIIAADIMILTVVLITIL